MPNRPIYPKTFEVDLGPEVSYDYLVEHVNLYKNKYPNYDINIVAEKEYGSNGGTDEEYSWPVLKIQGTERK